MTLALITLTSALIALLVAFLLYNDQLKAELNALTSVLSASLLLFVGVFSLAIIFNVSWLITAMTVLSAVILLVYVVKILSRTRKA